nr:Cytochrome P450 71A6 [Ipomoea batatas]
MTNSLLTSVGELSVLLWDIHVLCGLPISGDIYDEHVPSASEFIGTDLDPKSPLDADNIEMPISKEARSSNKRITGSNIGESEHSNNAQVQSSPKSRSTLDEPQKDHRNRPELRGKLDDTPIERIFSLQESFNNAFANLRKLDLDISRLEARVEEIFKKAHELDELRSTISEKTSSESQG